MKKKFALNKNTKTLHIIGGCRFTNHSLVGYELFSTEDGAVRAWVQIPLHRCTDSDITVRESASFGTVFKETACRHINDMLFAS